jgi:hypothetical protein
VRIAAALALALLTAFAVDAAAQSTARPRPPGTIPLEEAPPPPPMPPDDPDPALAPQVTVRMEGGQKIEEYRVNGRLYMQRITPAHGRPYVLVDNKGDGTFTRQDNTLDNRVRVPQWVIKEW